MALLIIITFGLVAQRAWIKSRGNRRFEGLSLEQTSLELDKVFEEQVAAGTITRADLEEVRAKAKAEFERERLSGRIDDGSV